MIQNKIINKRLLQLASCLFLILISSCEDEDKDPLFVDADVNNFAPYVRLLPPSSNIFDISQIADASYKGTLETPTDNVASWSVSVNRVSGGIQSETVFLRTISSFPSELEITSQAIATALNISVDDLMAGDNIQFIGSSLGTNGTELTFDDISGNITGQPAQFQSYEFNIIVGCPELTEPIDIVPGEWVINMGDSYGDGWQPTTNNGGGPGIVLTLNNGTVFEIGLCTPYETPGYNCTDGTNSGTRTITIPAGITSSDWEWEFRGDVFSEMSYEIITPNGNVVGTGSPGKGAGIIDDLLLCAQ